MTNHLRLSEKWFNRGLWLIAFLFAYFLTGLGGTIVGDLPKVENRLSTEDFVDKALKSKLTLELKKLDQEVVIASDKLDQAKLQSQTARADYQAARQAFEAWVTTRNATQDAEQDQDLLSRTAKLEKLKLRERELLMAVEAIQKQQLDTLQEKERVNRDIAALQEAARVRFEEDYKQIELRFLLIDSPLSCPCWPPPATCLPNIARKPTGPLSGASSFSACSPSL